MRNGLAAAATIGLLMLATAEGQAQQPGAGPVVQLPTFRFFTVSTTISIPDSGN